MHSSSHQLSIQVADTVYVKMIDAKIYSAYAVNNDISGVRLSTDIKSAGFRF